MWWYLTTKIFYQEKYISQKENKSMGKQRENTCKLYQKKSEYK